MIRLETINFIILIITGLIAYIPTVTLASFFSAWLADKIGDDTAKNHGLINLNPYNHIDLFYMISTLLFMPYLGFTKPIPVNINNLKVTSSFRNLRIIGLLFIDAIGYIIVLGIATFLMKLFTSNVILNFNELSSLTIVILRFFKIIFALTIFFIIVNFFWSLTRALIYFYFPELERSSYYFLFMFVISITLIFLLGSYIEYLIILYKLNIDKLFNYLFL